MNLTYLAESSVSILRAHYPKIIILAPVISSVLMFSIFE